MRGPRSSELVPTPAIQPGSNPLLLLISDGRSRSSVPAARVSHDTVRSANRWFQWLPRWGGVSVPQNGFGHAQLPDLGVAMSLWLSCRPHSGRDAQTEEHTLGCRLHVSGAGASSADWASCFGLSWHFVEPYGPLAVTRPPPAPCPLQTIETARGRFAGGSEGFISSHYGSVSRCDPNY